MDTENEELQVENGNFTRIINPVIDSLIKIPFKGCELAVALFIIRKTWGYQKKQDEISLSQFCSHLGRSRQTVVTALNNLQLVNMARLVKRGDSKKQSNIWEFNKYIDTWQLVKTARLVKRKRGTSLTEAPQLVKTARHTKEITKNNTKEKENNKRKIFTPPTLEEVKAYCNERENDVNPERFVNFYTMKGWKVGKQKMVDWRAAVRTWENTFKAKNNDTTEITKSFV